MDISDPLIYNKNHSSGLWSNSTIGQSTLRISEIFITTVILSATGCSIEGWMQHSLPDVVYYTSYGIIVAAIGCLFASCFCCASTTETEFRESFVELIEPKKVKKLGLSSQVHQLCEMDIEGAYLSCNLQQMVAITNEWKEKKLLHILNTIPSYFISNSYQKSAYDIATPLHTPLMHWASKGNLEAVKILCTHGAADNCYPYKLMAGVVTSALYVAAIEGHSAAVDYLLKQGATPTVQFNHNVLFSFVPYFVFAIYHNDKINHQNLDCLAKILSHLEKNAPNDLKNQLQVPVSKKQNCIAYMVEAHQKPQNHNLLVTMLKQFGGSENKVFSIDELEKLGCNIGTGCTLVEQASLKELF